MKYSLHAEYNDYFHHHGLEFGGKNLLLSFLSDSQSLAKHIQSACSSEDLLVTTRWESVVPARFYLEITVLLYKFHTTYYNPQSVSPIHKQHSTYRLKRCKVDQEWPQELDNTGSECRKRNSSPYDLSSQNRSVLCQTLQMRRARYSLALHRSEWSCYSHYGYSVVRKRAEVKTCRKEYLICNSLYMVNIESNKIVKTKNIKQIVM